MGLVRTRKPGTSNHTWCLLNLACHRGQFQKSLCKVVKERGPLIDKTLSALGSSSEAGVALRILYVSVCCVCLYTRVCRPVSGVFPEVLFTLVSEVGCSASLSEVLVSGSPGMGYKCVLNTF